MAGIQVPKELKYLSNLRYETLIPIQINNILLEDMLPGLFYIARLGRRRGKGAWNNRTPSELADELVKKTDRFRGFDSPQATALLADWLGAGVLRLRQRAGADRVMAVRPLHFMTYRVDLPVGWASLRYLPDFIAGLLLKKPGQAPASNDAREAFGLQSRDNLLLRAFGAGMVNDSPHFGDATGDRYDEETPLDIETLLCVRAVEDLPPPAESTRDGEIKPFEPLCPRQARIFREDMTHFLRSYGAGQIPARTLANYVLCLLSVNLTSYFLSHVCAANHLYEKAEWLDDHNSGETGRLWPLGMFADATEGLNRRVRSLAQRSYAIHHEWLAQYTRTTLGFRLLDHYLDGATWVPELRDLKDKQGIERLIILAKARLDTTSKAFDAVQASANPERNKLRQAQEGEEWPEEVRLIAEDSSVRPFEGLVELLSIGLKGTREGVFKFYISIARKNMAGGLLAGDKTGHARNRYVLTTDLLEALVHRLCLRKSGGARLRRLDVYEFVDELKTRYGIWIDEPPPGLPSTHENRQAGQENFEAFKERLRLLGLFRGVSDARRMQRLKPRYHPSDNCSVDAGGQMQ